ncbi:hypothetical protein SUGI_0814330 [Cryptomeria japonica]|uniref:uncharacterized protein LOC131048419 n=1 Tax=Cryptomeria japonica TaxID=3369 RepID=UPI0024149504|nr:uncharacterized protein LOC131048419 [Cryptomeria japonica]GLJ39836.1 hypothetical protein SUGI_0814330 [Cryptomeria japonica]
MSVMAINAIAPFASNVIFVRFEVNNTSKSRKGAYLPTQRNFSLTRFSSGYALKAIEGECSFRRKLLAVKFSSSNSEESTSELKTKTELIGERDNDGSNPPFLTILAGIVVFLLFAWALGSIVIGIIRIFLG